ncbi:hypothetical protein GOP47_0016979 [Adiantum capillus-veneris]|uniref:Phosphatidate cytidylyltransferase n=1 Tax=Adiantum capillus-veneris TaxID=13818 RepID=A0A9D4ZB71_ADICA|nr:hypothetical protein GOP47_0016979 [Adiantum capillus-veneris]
MDANKVPLDDQKTCPKFLTRTCSTIWMLVGFFLILYMGHVYIWAMIVVIQIFMANELFNLAARARKEKSSLGAKPLNWFFFFTAMWYVYGYLMSKHLTSTIAKYKTFTMLFNGIIQYHTLTCYLLYLGGFTWFILTLRKGRYLYQFGQFAWAHMILIFVLLQSAFSVANVFEGIIWFLLPASLIVINDIAAYLCGLLIGRTPLIKLSPKKTWEGFGGALIVTLLSAFLLADWMGRSPWLTCPRQDLSTGPLSCDPNPSFHSLRSWHALAYGLFASIAAPFGGFFASGFKRAFRIKDFGDSIPGHGGITDRMDCQMVMAVFSYIYYQSFIAPPKLNFADILNQALYTLTREQQVELYTSLGKVLASGSMHFCFK